MSSRPWEFDEARARCAAASIQQKSAENAKLDAAKTAAQAEHDYRILLAQTIVTQHANGVAWTAAADLAKGDPAVAQLRMARDVAVGVRDGLDQAVWRSIADRKDTARFAVWSMRTAVADGSIHGGDQRLQWSGRDAA